MRGWKKYEQDLTEYLNGKAGREAIRRSRAERGEDVMDVEWGDISVEAKCKAGRPQYMEAWLAQANKNCEGKTPIVVWHQAYEKIDDDIVMLRLYDLISLLLNHQLDDNLDKHELKGKLEDVEEVLEEIRDSIEYR